MCVYMHVHVIYWSVSTYKQARSQEVRGGGGGGYRLILLKAFIRGAKYKSGGVGGTV